MNSKDNKYVTITFSNRTIVRTVVFILIALALMGLLAKISLALKLILISGFLALALNPAVNWISGKLPSKSRVRATAVAYAMIIAFLVLFISTVLPPLVRQSVSFVETIPLTVEDIHNQDTSLVRFIDRHNLTNEYTQVVSELKSNFNNITSKAYSVVTKVGGGLVSMITVLVMTFMMLIEGPAWITRVLSLQPKEKVKKNKKLLNDMYRMVTGYVNGQLLIAMIAATFAFFALVIASTILDVRINPVALAAIVGLIGLIPMIGNTIAAVLVVLFCLLSSLPLAIVMLIFFLVYQQAENATLQPYIQSKYNELTPLTVFIAAIIGVSVAGFLGALVAIPLVGCLRIYLKDNYGDRLSPGASIKDRF